MKIKPNTKYRMRSGLIARVYAIDGHGIRPIHGACACSPDKEDPMWCQFTWLPGGVQTETIDGKESPTQWDLMEEIKPTTEQ
jgi:hypothetical protein